MKLTYILTRCLAGCMISCKERSWTRGWEWKVRVLTPNCSGTELKGNGWRWIVGVLEEGLRGAYQSSCCLREFWFYWKWQICEARVSPAAVHVNSDFSESGKSPRRVSVQLLFTWILIFLKMANLRGACQSSCCSREFWFFWKWQMSGARISPTVVHANSHFSESGKSPRRVSVQLLFTWILIFLKMANLRGHV
jgi:hypothetical protein